MISILLALTIGGCNTTDNVDNINHLNVVDNISIEDFSHLESPCLDGILTNMSDRGCNVSIIEMENKSTRYFCLDSENLDRTDVWMARAFYVFPNEETLDHAYLDEHHYKQACSDWSQRIFYR